MTSNIANIVPFYSQYICDFFTALWDVNKRNGCGKPLNVNLKTNLDAKLSGCFYIWKRASGRQP